MIKLKWDTNYIPDQKGKIIIITGSTSGLGKEAAKVLAHKNATIIMAVRNVAKGEECAKEIKNSFKSADISVMELDLTSLKLIKQFSDKFLIKFKSLDILINNAGIMMCPYSKTVDGFEIQMGTNHFGHFALTGHLLAILKKTPGSRIVATASIAHKMGNINFDDINWEKRKYNTMRAYGDSKLANLYFDYELSRKLGGSVSPMVTAAHPGVTNTDLMRHSGLMKIFSPIFGQSQSLGTLPTLRAAIDPDAKSGNYYGPSGFRELFGHPVKVESNKLSHNIEAAKKLWNISEKLTGVKY